MQRLLLPLLFVTTIARIYGQDVGLTVQTGHSSTINSLDFSYDGSLLVSTGRDGRVVVWDVLSGKQLTTLIAHTKSVNQALFRPGSTSIASISDDGKFILWDLNSGEPIKEVNFAFALKGLSYSPDGKSVVVAGKEVHLISLTDFSIRKVNIRIKESIDAVAFSSDGKKIISAGRRESRIQEIDIESGKRIKQFPLKTNDLALSADGQYIVAAGVNGRAKKITTVPKFLPTSTIPAERIWQSYLSVAANGTHYAIGNKNKMISVLELKNGRKVHTLFGHEGPISALAFSKTLPMLASASVDHKVLLWDLSSGEIIKKLQGSAAGITATAIVNNGENVVLGYENGLIRYIDVDPGGVILSAQIKTTKQQRRKLTTYSITDIYNKRNSVIELEAQKLRQHKRHDKIHAKRYRVFWDIESNKIKMRNEVFRGLSQDGKKMSSVMQRIYDSMADSAIHVNNLIDLDSAAGIQVALKNGSEVIITNKAGDKITVSPKHSQKVTAVKINFARNFFLTSSKDGLTKFWDLRTGENMTTFLVSGETDFIYINPANFYYATKGALDNIGFKIGSSIYSFEQFDMIYNRPDLVLQSVRYQDMDLVHAYQQAHRRRMSKETAPIKEESDRHDIPLLKLAMQTEKLILEKPFFNLKLEASALKTPIQKVVILVNGVPAYQEQLSKSVAFLQKEIPVELSQGINRVQVYVINESGNSSLWQSVQVRYKTKYTKPALYLVTIGASKYKDDAYNLNYAAKDANDLKELFAKSNKYKKIYSQLVINEDVKLSKLDEIENWLKGAGVNDVVIISFSGHGLLDEKLDYYLSSYDVDFDSPSTRGIPLLRVEMLLKNLKSRNKMLILDACHSGEFDKDEVELVTSASTPEGEISFRNVNASVRNKSNTSLKSTFELSKALFADISTDHGAMVISSAGGGEYAIEGSVWKNGIFTYCLINGLKNKKADLNKDNQISIAELQRYLTIEVPRLTGGKQTPTSREENLYNNFIIW